MVGIIALRLPIMKWCTVSHLNHGTMFCLCSLSLNAFVYHCLYDNMFAIIFRQGPEAQTRKTARAVSQPHLATRFAPKVITRLVNRLYKATSLKHNHTNNRSSSSHRQTYNSLARSLCYSQHQTSRFVPGKLLPNM